VGWAVTGRLLQFVQRGVDWAGPQPPTPLLAVSNVTAYTSTASVPNYQSPFTDLLYNGPLLCGFDVPVKGLKYASDFVYVVCEM